MKTLRRLKHKLNNLLYWLPVIWQDRDFDYSYLLIILQHKLKAMHKFFLSDYALTLSAKDTAAEIKVALDALDRIIEDDYCMKCNSDDSMMKCFEKANKLQDADLHIVFNILEEKVIEWWD